MGGVQTLGGRNSTQRLLASAFKSRPRPQSMDTVEVFGVSKSGCLRAYINRGASGQRKCAPLAHFRTSGLARKRTQTFCLPLTWPKRHKKSTVKQLRFHVICPSWTYVCSPQFPWVSMGFHGFPWVSMMGFHDGFPWVSMGKHAQGQRGCVGLRATIGG